jgi:hypothetical protein
MTAAVEREPAATRPEPVDYAALNAIYAVALAGVVIATRRRRDAEPIRPVELLPMGAATFAIAKAVSREKIGSWIREPLTEEHVADVGSVPERRALATLRELVTCSRCIGTWSALGVVGLRAASPSTGRLVTAVFATSAANDVGQAAFRWLCERSNRAAQT